MFLIFDSNHFERTGKYCLRDRNRNEYTFDNALDAKNFTDHYYINPVAAIFAYSFAFEFIPATEAGLCDHLQ